MRRFGAICALVLALLLPMPARAASPQPQGLFVAPARDYIAIDAGHQQQKQLTVANYTDKQAVIMLTVQRFAIADYTYDFTFAPTDENWIKLGETQLQLQPGKSQTVPYTLDVPAGATPGGHYFTILVSTTVQTGAVQSKLQAAALIYATVQGTLRKTSQVSAPSVSIISFGGDIPYTFDVQNTGNTHFFVYASGELRGWTAAGPGAPSTHLLMPRTTRTLGGLIPAPLFPGVYTAHFGYKTDAGETVERTGTVVYAPWWVLLIGVGCVGLIISIVRRVRRRWLRGLRLPPYTS